MAVIKYPVCLGKSNTNEFVYHGTFNGHTMYGYGKTKKKAIKDYFKQINDKYTGHGMEIFNCKVEHYLSKKQ